MIITKEIGFLGINQKIGTISSGREYYKDIRLSQESNDVVLIFESKNGDIEKKTIQ